MSIRCATMAAGLLAGFTALAGCSTVPATIKSASTNKVVPETSAYVIPPPGGPGIVGVSERLYANGREQQISLATNSTIAGQNAIRVRLYGKVERDAREKSSLPGSALANTSLSFDMIAAVGNVRMQKAPYYVQNRYGPFGYAMGRSGANLCMYGWQQIRSKPGFGGNKGRIDVRARICHRDGTEQGLLAFMYGYTINAYVDDPSWNPYGTAASAPDDLGKASADIYPLGATRFEQVTSAPPKPRPTVKRVRPKVVQAIPAEELPAPTGPTVPPPAADSGGAPVIPTPNN